MPKVGTAYVSIRARLNKLEKDLADAKSLTTKRAKETQRAVSKVFKGALAYLGVRELKRFGDQLFETGKQVARLEKSFNEITGSTSAANAEFAFLRETSDDLGQNFYDLADAYKSLLAASKGTVLEGQATRDVFIGITKAAASLGLTSDQTTGALNAVQQMMSKGKVQAEELRGQLGERLPGAFNLAAEAMGVTTAELNKMLDDGKVLASDLLPKLGNLLQNRYSGNVDKATRASNKFAEAWTDIKVTMSESGFLDSVSNAIDSIAETLKDPNVQRGLSDFAKNMGLLVEGMAKLSKYAGLRSVTNTFGQILEMRRQGQITDAQYTQLVEAGFLERQRLLDDIIAKQKQVEESALKIALHGAAPLPSTGPEQIYNPWKNVKSESIELTQKQIDKVYELMGAENERLERDMEAEAKLTQEKLKSQERVKQSILDFKEWEFKQFGAQADRIIEIQQEKGEELQKRNEKLAEDMKSAFAGWANNFSSTLNDMVWNAEASFSDILKSFWQMITQMLIQKSLIEPLVSGFSGLFVSSAQGNVFSGPGISAYENKIVTRPTLFPFASGIGLMGEAGAEAILPLTRTSSGDLGVKSSSGGNVTINIIDKTGSDVSVQQRQTQAGPEIDVIVDQIVGKKMRQYGTISNKSLRQMGAQQPLIMR